MIKETNNVNLQIEFKQNETFKVYAYKHNNKNETDIIEFGLLGLNIEEISLNVFYMSKISFLINSKIFSWSELRNQYSVI